MLSQNPRAMQQSSPTNGASTQVEQHLRAQLEFLQKHDADPSSLSAAASNNPRETRGGPATRPPNGFDVLASPAPNAPRLANVKSEAESHIHPDLRAPSGHAPIPNMMPIPPPPPAPAQQQQIHPSAPTAVPGPSAVAPLAPAPPPPMSAPAVVDDAALIDGRKAKRELSQSKRAAQNRAAQRAFRQRKEGYIKKLEQQVRDYSEMERTFDALRSENGLLRDYITQLQARLLEVHGDFPPPPPSVNLLLQQPATSAAPAPVPVSHDAAAAAAAQASHAPGAGTPLEAVAQAVAGLAAQEQIDRHQSYPSPPFKQAPGEEDTRTTEEINRQLNSEHAAQS